MTTTLPPLAEAYLARLRAAASVLPADQAAELVSDISEHLSIALGPDSDVRDAAAVLDALGAPEQRVSDAAGGAGATAPEPSSSRREWIALACLVASVPLVVFWPAALVTWIVGVSAMLTSRRWTVADKGFGMVLAFAPAMVAVMGLAGFSAMESCASDGTGPEVCTQVGQPLIPAPFGAVLLIAWLVLAGYGLVRLLRRLR